MYTHFDYIDTSLKGVLVTDGRCFLPGRLLEARSILGLVR